MARCREFCIAERVKCRELFLTNILYVDSALDLMQLTCRLLSGAVPGGGAAFWRFPVTSRTTPKSVRAVGIRKKVCGFVFLCSANTC